MVFDIPERTMQENKTEQYNDIEILIIEDETDVRESYVDMFGFMGVQVDSASNGVEGLQKLEQKHFDIVLTDLNMPVMDGLETLRRIKKKDDKIEVIVITGFATIENAISAMKQGAFDYITKPVSFDHVKIVLNKCIQKIYAWRENIALKNSNTQLKELNELKDKFITITNHELRTPLAVLRGYFDLLEMEIADKETGEYIEIINNTINEMMDMVESMHNLSSFKNYGRIQKKQRVDLNRIAAETAREVKILYDQRKIALELRLASDPVQTVVDEKMIHKAIREILGNALKYTQESGRVTITTKNIWESRQVFLEIKDTGIGIPKKKVNLIFEPFYEVQDVLHHSTSKTDFMGGGIGVGLSLVKEMVESNGGEIVVESTPGEGSNFTIVLPLARH